MRILDAVQVAELFDLEAAAQSQRTAFLALGAGRPWQPDKLGGSIAGDLDTAFCYAARLDAATGIVSKVGSVVPGNRDRGLPAVHSVLTLLDATTGAPVAILDGGPLTELRTAAASALAVEHLAVERGLVLMVLGAGVQAKAHVRAIGRVRHLEAVTMWSLHHEEAERAASELRDEGWPVTAVGAVADAVSTADVVVCATLAITPLFAADDLKPGSTVISIGSFEAHRLEIGVDVLERSAAVVVDSELMARRHAGPVVAHEWELGRPVPVVELGHVVGSPVALRQHETDVLVYLSVGLGVQDAAAAWAVYERALALDLGTTVDWPPPPPRVAPIRSDGDVRSEAPGR